MKLVDTSKAWYVVRTNIRCEDKAASNIRQAGFDVYLPKYRVEKWNKRRNTFREHERMLMPGYLFVGMRDEKVKHFGFVRACEGVERFLEYRGNPLRCPPDDIASIQGAEMDLVFDDTRAARIHRKEEAATYKATVKMKFPKGSEVMVDDGPFKSPSQAMSAPSWRFSGASRAWNSSPSRYPQQNAGSWSTWPLDIIVSDPLQISHR
jgi:transcription termination/antitermination protein NusG